MGCCLSGCLSRQYVVMCVMEAAAAASCLPACVRFQRCTKQHTPAALLLSADTVAAVHEPWRPCWCCLACRQLNALDIALHKRALELLEKRRSHQTTAGKLQALPPVAVAQHRAQRGRPGV